MDAKFDLDDPSDERGFNPDVTTGDILNDPDRETADFVKDESTWWSVNLAVVRPLAHFQSQHSVRLRNTTQGSNCRGFSAAATVVRGNS